ncbi:MAG: AbrB/MazE/SpoVT family DNA-binding domain-containing protein [Patescibacteria group bacterium]
MANKIIKIGSSAAVTIPKKVLASLAIDIGDKVYVNVDGKNRRIIIEPLVNFQLKESTAQHIESFIKKYKKELEKLSE